jgi:DNA-binding MarR family transcriptional regulator
VGDLARRVNLSQATVTGILDRLEQRRLIRRRRSSHDRRRVLVTVTEPGAEVLASAPPPLQEHFTRRFAALDPAEQDSMVRALERVVELMAADAVAPSPLLHAGELPEEPCPVGDAEAFVPRRGDG